MEITSQLIYRLKQQSRIGFPGLGDMPTPDPSGWEAFTNALGATDNAMDMLLSTQANTILGAKQLTSINIGLAESFKALGKDLVWLENRNAILNKTLGINIKQAAMLGSTLDDLSKSYTVGGKNLRIYASNLKSITGNFTTAATLSTEFGKKLLHSQQIITNALQLSAEQATKFEQYSAGIGEAGADQLVATNNVAKAIEQATGQQGLFKEIVGDISSLTEDLQLQYGRIPGNLQLAVVKAKALGLSMKDLNSAGENLLNIESSIGQELEYQLLSGHRLVDQQGKSLTNAYRTATIQGDSSKQADLMNKILEQEGDTLKNNLFARKQMSQLLGTDEASLARALQKKSILESIGGGELFEMSGSELLDAAKSMGASSEQLNELAKAEDTRSTDEKLADTLDVMITKGIRATIVDQVGAITGTSESLMGGMQNISSLGDALGENMAMFTGYTVRASQAVDGVISIIDKADNVLSSIKDIMTGDIAGGLQTIKSTLEALVPGDIEDVESYTSTVGNVGGDVSVKVNDFILETHPRDVLKETSNGIAGGTALGGGDANLSATMLQVGAMIVAAIKNNNVDYGTHFG
jgi:hypothetical protein